MSYIYQYIYHCVVNNITQNLQLTSTQHFVHPKSTSIAAEILGNIENEFS